MIEYVVEEQINYDEKIDKKWYFLQYIYQLWMANEYSKELLKVKENNGSIHSIYLNLNKEEFLLYLYFLDIKEVKFRGKNSDCIVEYEENKVTISYYDKKFVQDIEDMVQETKNFVYEQIPDFGFKMYFYVPEKDQEFYYKLISFIYYLSEVDIQQYGIKICDRKGNFQKYNSLKFPHDNLDKFVYYDGNIFIGSHSQTNMIIIYNLPKEKLLELRRWCNEY